MVPKSRASLERYGHQIVVGNLLSTRKRHILFVTHDSQHRIDLENDDIEIESLIVDKLSDDHLEWTRKLSLN